MPFALVTTVIVVGTVMVLAQAVAVGTLPGLEAASTPLASAAATFMGAGGALLIGIGSLVSMSGNLAGQILTGSRMIFALAENGDLPPVLARIHPVYRTPAAAILFTATAALALALSGTFVWMAVASAIARLIIYSGSCGAAIAFRQSRWQGRVRPAAFLLRGGATVPTLAILVSLLIVIGASRAQVIGGLTALAAGAFLFVLARPHRRHVG
jgi:amino acid transporter